MTNNLFNQNKAFIKPSIPIKQSAYWGQLYGSADALAIAQLASNNKESLLVICNSSAEALRLRSALDFFLRKEITDIIHFPSIETLPYDRFSPHPNIISQRLQVLYQLVNHQSKQQIVLCDLQTAILNLPPVNYIREQVIIFQQGDTLDIEEFRAQLNNAGYYAVSEVRESGEYAVRGNLVDLYPSGSPLPYRIDLFDDEIESVRSFDPSTQRTIAKLPELRLLPAREFPLHDQGRKEFRQNYRTRFEGDPTSSPIYQDISDGNIPPGIEYFLPLFFSETGNLFDYIDDRFLIVQHQNNQHENAAKLTEQWREIEERYEQRAHDVEFPILTPDEIFLNPEKYTQSLCQFPLIELSNAKADPLELSTNDYIVSEDSITHFLSQALPSLRIDTKKERPLAAFENFLAEQNQPCLVVASSAGRHEIIVEYFKEGMSNLARFCTFETDIRFNGC